MNYKLALSKEEIQEYIGSHNLLALDIETSPFEEYRNDNKASLDAHKMLRQVEFRTQSADHPILWNNDESYYLKFYIFQVVEGK